MKTTGLSKFWKRSVFLTTLTFVILPSSFGLVVPPDGVSYNGDVHPSFPLNNFIDGDTASICVLEGTSNNDPTGRTVTFTFNQAYDFTQLTYWGDNDLGSEQGINAFTLEFFLGAASQGTYSDSFANLDNTNAQDRIFGATYTADSITLTLDSVYSGAPAFGSVNAEIEFDGTLAQNGVPTLSRWGLFLMVGLLTLCAFFVMRKRTV